MTADDALRNRLAALREIYDGHYTRHLGSASGETIEWEGKAGLLAAVTDTIDQHLGVMGTMGPRFLLYRMPNPDTQSLIAATASTLGHEDRMRDALANAVKDFMAAVELPGTPVAVSADPALAALAARARSPIERDTHYSRDIELVPRPEVGSRLYRALAQLARGLQTIGPCQRRDLAPCA